MKNLNLIFIPLLLFCGSCASTSKFSRNSSEQIHSFRNEFHQLMQISKNRDEEFAWNQWQILVESKDRKFFQAVVAGSNEDPDWQKKYRASFDKAWPILQKYQTQIENEFDRFPNLFEENFSRFKKHFSDFDLSMTPVFAVPSLLKFNGKGTEAYGPKVLSFGIDTIVFMREEPKYFPRFEATSNAQVLYAHEMFHIYHGQQQKLLGESASAIAELINDAWNEGLATFVSGEINPSASDADLLMDKELARQCKSHGNDLVRRFSTVAQEKSQSPIGKINYRDWFLIASKDNTLPLRAGYCVGLILARRVHQSGISVTEMAKWPFAEVPARLSRYLQQAH